MRCLPRVTTLEASGVKERRCVLRRPAQSPDGVFELETRLPSQLAQLGQRLHLLDGVWQVAMVLDDVST
jgi:hypothetical protein